MSKVLTWSRTCFLVAVATPALGQTDDDWQRCRAITADSERLACYDELTPAPAAAAPQPETPPATAIVSEETNSTAEEPPTPVQVATAPVVAATAPPTTADVELDDPEDLFGRTDKQIRDAAVQKSKQPGSPDRLSAAIVGVQATASGRFRVTLDNGQIWTQSESMRFRLRTGDAIEIRRGSMGTYFLKKQGKNRSVRVRRTD
ncbi:MAG: hypothetical protein AAGH76_01730 [Pseudomonadota bacterium]